MTTEYTLPVEQAAARALAADSIVSDAAKSLRAQATLLDGHVIVDEDATAQMIVHDTLSAITADLIHDRRWHRMLDGASEAAAVKQLRQVANSLAFLAGQLEAAANGLDGLGAEYAEQKEAE